MKVATAEKQMSLMRRVWTHFGSELLPYWPLCVVVVLLSITTTAIELVKPWPIKILVDSVLVPAGNSILPDERMLALVVKCAAGVLTIGLLGGILNYFLDVRIALLANKIVSRIRKSVFRRLIRLPALFFNRQKSGDLIVRLTGDVQLLRDFVVEISSSVLGRSLLLLGLISAMLWLNPLMTLCLLLCLPVMAILFTITNRRLLKFVRRQRQKEGKLASAAYRMLSAFRLVVVYGREDLEDRNFAELNRQSFREGLKARRTQARLSQTSEVILAIGVGAVVLIGGWSVLKGKMTAGDLILFISYLRSIFKPARSLVGLSSRIAKAAAGSERLLDIMDEPVTICSPSDPEPIPEAIPVIEYQNVTIAYDREAVIEDFNLEIHPGECVAFRGPSGSGKTSAALLLPRFYDPVHGCVTLDGIDLRRFDLQALRGKMTVVLQESLIFGASLYENIEYGAPGCGEQAIWDALERVNLWGWARSLPEGLRTQLAEGGTDLSGGQRARVALARALVRDTPIWILDEPFEGLDYETAQEVTQLTFRLLENRTCIIISHDEALLGQAHRSVWFDKRKSEERQDLDRLSAVPPASAGETTG